MSHKLIYNDSTHAYTLNGRRAKSVTAVAKIVQDSWALDQWRKRQVAIGMMLEPRLAERIAVDPENRETVDQICEEAMQVAGAHHAANRGTQRHRASELADTGGVLLTEQQRLDAAAWQRTLEHHGIEILPDHVEGFVIYPAHGVVGRYDRFARWRGRTRIVDLKSGSNAVKYPQSTEAQLGTYANAPLISASVSTSGDRSTVTEWTTPPADLDLETGLVVLLSDDMEVGELWEIDIAHGWTGAQHALSLVDWRKATSRTRQAVDPGPSPLPRLAAQAESNGLLGLIDKAATVDQLNELWAAHQQAWTGTHTAAAARRKRHLQTPAAVSSR